MGLTYTLDVLRCKGPHSPGTTRKSIAIARVALRIAHWPPQLLNCSAPRMDALPASSASMPGCSSARDADFLCPIAAAYGAGIPPFPPPNACSAFLLAQLSLPSLSRPDSRLGLYCLLSWELTYARSLTDALTRALAPQGAL